MKLPFKIRSTALLYSTNPAGLHDILLDSIGSQCWIVRKGDTDVYQAEIASFLQQKKIVELRFAWSCKRRLVSKVIGGLPEYEDRWDPHLFPHAEVFTYSVYYLHAHKRLKIKSPKANYYLLDRDDLENLVTHEGEFLRIGKLQNNIDVAPHIEPFK